MASPNNLNFWNNEHDQVVIDNFGKVPAWKIGEMIGRTAAAVQSRASLLRAKHKIKLAGYKVPEWSQEEVEFLKKNYRTMLVTDIAKHLNKSINAIRGKADRLNIRVGCKISSIVKNINSRTKDKSIIRKTTGSCGIHLLDLKENTCRFPFDDKTFCGKHTDSGVYCEEHNALCYVQSKKPVKLGRW